MADVMSLETRRTPRDLGELLSAEEIRQRFYKGRCSAKWVRSRMADMLPSKGVQVGRFIHWYERDVADAIAANREG